MGFIHLFQYPGSGEKPFKIIGLTIINAVEISRLSKDEKLKIMEAIWEDLSRDEEQIE